MTLFPRPYSHRTAETTRAFLVERFPKLFAPKGAAKLPLALGVADDIIGLLPEIGRRRLHAALDDYTSGPTYLGSIVAGAPRFDLEGKLRGEVTEPEAKYARERMTSLPGYSAGGAK